MPIVILYNFFHTLCLSFKEAHLLIDEQGFCRMKINGRRLFFTNSMQTSGTCPSWFINKITEEYTEPLSKWFLCQHAWLCVSEATHLGFVLFGLFLVSRAIAKFHYMTNFYFFNAAFCQWQMGIFHKDNLHTAGIISVSVFCNMQIHNAVCSNHNYAKYLLFFQHQLLTPLPNDKATYLSSIFQFCLNFNLHSMVCNYGVISNFYSHTNCPPQCLRCTLRVTEVHSLCWAGPWGLSISSPV